jgi:hypothetical protein
LDRNNGVQPNCVLYGDTRRHHRASLKKYSISQSNGFRHVCSAERNSTRTLEYFIHTYINRYILRDSRSNPSPVRPLFYYGVTICSITSSRTCALQYARAYTTNNYRDERDGGPAMQGFCAATTATAAMGRPPGNCHRLDTTSLINYWGGSSY